MAKISSCYQLCPLIDQKSFLGVSDDCENGYVIVTLGKNMVIRYKISDQKQVNSWNTKVRLSAPVVYNRASGEYVGVFNMTIIRLWKASDVDLHKVNKYKFKDNIHCVLSCRDTNTAMSADSSPLVILFKDGRIAPLTSSSLDKRKDTNAMCNGMTPILNVNTDTIEDSHLLMLDGNCVVAIISSNNNTKKLTCHLIALQQNLFMPVCCDLDKRQNNTVDEDGGKVNADAKLVCYTFINGDTLKLLTLWSDGKLYCLELYLLNLETISSQFPGEEIMEIKTINTALKVAILPLDNIGCYMAVYGADPNEEGALLLIINIMHRLVQCKYNFKLYCMSPKLWSGGQTDLLLIVGQYLAVAHYRLVKQKLAALVGTQSDNSVVDNAVFVNWGKSENSATVSADEKKISDKNILINDDSGEPLDKPNQSSLHVVDTVDVLLKEGLSEIGICERIVPTFLETMDTGSLTWVFKNLNDIPLNCTLMTIGYCLQQIESNSSGGSDDKGGVKNKKKKLLKCDVAKSLLKNVLLTSVVPDSKAFSLVQSTISLPASVILIEYLIDFLMEYPGNIQLIDWATLLLDTYYRWYIISKDINMIKVFRRLSMTIDDQISIMSTWQSILPLLRMVKNGRGVPKHMQEIESDSLYSLDKLNVD